MTDTPRRKFLGWDGPALPRVASWLVEHAVEVSGRADGGLEDVIVALPGRRAARRLEQHLARALPRGAAAPRLVPVGHLPDELLLPERPFAGRLLRTLVWRDALRGLPEPRRRLLLHHAPASTDEGAWLTLAEELRALHGELMRDMLDFGNVVGAAGALGGPGEARRWEVLADARVGYLERLRSAGFDDPHEGRREALRADRLEPGRRVVLAGVAELNGLVRGLLERLGPRATVLVLAPREQADDFDALGAVQPEAWAGRSIHLPADAWQLAGRPDEQAALVVQWLAARAAGRRPDEAVVGVPDAEVAPHLQRHLMERGTLARDAAGTPLPRTAPARLLQAVAEHLAAPSFATFAALLRHPDLLAALRRADARVPADLLARLDADHAARLHDALPARWPGPREDAERLAVERAHAALEAWLAPLAGPPRRAGEWAEPLAGLLRSTWGAAELSDAREDERLLAGALAALGEALRELAALPAAAGAPLPAVEALRLLLRAVERGAVAPAGESQAVELLGWLELPLDDAPLLAVTGFNEGRVPASSRGHALLPDALRSSLGLPDDRRRLARDAYALTLLARARRDLLLVTGRRSQDGDPLRPSRLAFLAPDDVAVERAARFGREDPSPPAPAAPVAASARRRPRLPAPAPPRKVSVTALGAWLQSPYRFYVERLLRLQRARDDERELGPLPFGSLAHEALALLAEPGASAERDGARLAAALRGRLAQLARARFGEHPAPAVVLQLDHLAWRFDGLAAWQAGRHALGWQVTHAEWGAGVEVPLDVDGGRLLLTGRIDRIEVGPGGAWRIADYKTGDKTDAQAGDPLATHGGAGGKDWKDLQLPLYELLAEPLRAELEDRGARGRPELGYIVLPRERPGGDDWWRPGTPHLDGRGKPRGWSADDLERALAAARTAGAAILRGDFDDRGDWDPDDEVFAAILGEGLLVETDDENGEGGG